MVLNHFLDDVFSLCMSRWRSKLHIYQVALKVPLKYFILKFLNNVNVLLDLEHLKFCSLLPHWSEYFHV